MKQYMDQEFKKEMSLLEYLRAFHIGSIPFVDFIFNYIIIYFINHYFIKASLRKTLIATIPITIILEALFDKKYKLSLFPVIIIIICFILLAI